MGKKEISARFIEKSKTIKEKMQKTLWDKNSDFFKVLPRNPEARLCNTRELHGLYTMAFNSS